MIKKIPQLPSIVWVFIFVGGIVLLIGGIITVMTLLFTVEGIASLIFLGIGLTYVFAPKDLSGMKADPIARAIGVGFFALMGMAIDQTGNFIYNYPLRYFCPEGTVLNRSVDVTHPLPGRTDMTQDYSCFDSNGKFVARVGMGPLIGVRFVEYLILAYVLIGVRDLKNKVSKVSHEEPKQ